MDAGAVGDGAAGARCVQQEAVVGAGDGQQECEAGAGWLQQARKDVVRPTGRPLPNPDPSAAAI